MAYFDDLTGLLNRNWYALNKSKINKKWVYFIDINNLHNINSKGHSVGDEYIKRIVGIIKNKLKKNDLFIRYGGDEFLIFSDEKNLIKDEELYSVGYCEIKENIEEAINYADHKMLSNKR